MPAASDLHRVAAMHGMVASADSVPPVYIPLLDRSYRVLYRLPATLRTEMVVDLMANLRSTTILI